MPNVPVAAVAISIHTLREEGDDALNSALKNQKKFLSTPSARRVTPEWGRGNLKLFISIHTLREEGDSP